MHVTFKKVHSIAFPGPYVNVCIHPVRRYPTPTSLKGHGITVTCAVISVLVQPVPTVSHEIGVEANGDFPVRRSFFPDPVKNSVEPTFTHTW